MNQELNADSATGSRDCAHGAEWADTLPALFRSEGFFEDLPPEPAPVPARTPTSRAGAGGSPLLGQMLASVLSMRRA